MLAKGIFFGLGDGGGPEVFNQIINVTSFNLSGTTWAEEDQTSHDNATPVKTTALTVRDEGKISLIINPYVKGNTYHAALRTLAESPNANNFRVTYPGSEMGSFDVSGFVTSFAFETPVNGILKAKVDIKINGALVDDAAKLLTVTVTDSQAGDYITGEFMELTATYDEYVVVTGTPRIAVPLTSGTVYATYVSGSNTNILKFRKTFGSGDIAAASGVSVTSPIDLNSGTILDLGGNAASLTFTPPDTSAFHVN
jgi:hypothetical protein